MSVPEHGDGVVGARHDRDVKKPRVDSELVQPNPEPRTRLVSAQNLELLPAGKRSLAGISARAFLLGSAFSSSLALALFFGFSRESQLWRPSIYIFLLSLFHFLEFYITAKYNTKLATVSAFLLSSNGRAYTGAHVAALSEATFSALILPSWQKTISPPWVVVLGFSLIVIGQGTRTAAMVQAGTNFNHHIQREKNNDHELVTSGIYSILRHPSYFGYFWWGLGTQLIMGNAMCFATYAVLLWRFFQHRIRSRS